MNPDLSDYIQVSTGCFRPNELVPFVLRLAWWSGMPDDGVLWLEFGRIEPPYPLPPGRIASLDQTLEKWRNLPIAAEFGYLGAHTVVRQAFCRRFANGRVLSIRVGPGWIWTVEPST